MSYFLQRDVVLCTCIHRDDGNMISSDESSCDGSCGSCAEHGTCTDPKAQDKTPTRLGRIKHKIVVGSGKGGVGKSTVTVNLAVALKRRGYSVGILDADITGPNIPKLLGIDDRRLTSGPEGIEPAVAEGIKVVSMALLLEDRDAAVVWRGPMKMAAIKQFLEGVNWGVLDFMLVDLPPGTSDEPISVIQLLPDLEGAIVVTTPQELALLDSRKAINMFLAMNVPLIGIVENMSGLRCPHCGQVIELFKVDGGKNAAGDMGAHFLGAVPLEADIGALGDRGVTFTGRETVAGRAFEKIVSEVLMRIGVPRAVDAILTEA